MSTTSSTSGYRWAITTITQSRPTLASGHAPTHPDAWTAALTAARAALLAGDLDDLAVTINDDLQATYQPARDQHGHLDPADVTHTLVDIHQDVTAPELAAELTRLTRADTEQP